MKWIRTCQECGHKQEDVDPKNNPTPAYLERKCKKCKSIGLDYGKQDKQNTKEEE